MSDVRNMFPSETRESFVLRLKNKIQECDEKLRNLDSSIKNTQICMQELNVQRYALCDTLTIHNKSLKYIDTINHDPLNMELYHDLNTACSEIKHKISDIHDTIEKHRESNAEKSFQFKSLTNEISLHRRALGVIEKN